MTVRFPSAPLEQAAGGGNVVELAARLRVSRPTINRWRAVGIIWSHADEAACRLGLHPSEIWPDWYMTLEEAAVG